MIDARKPADARRFRGRLPLLWAVCAAGLAATGSVPGLALWSALGPGERAQALAILAANDGLFVALAGLLLGASGLLARAIHGHLLAMRRIADEVRLVAESNPGHRLASHLPAELDLVVAAVNGLAERYQAAGARLEEAAHSARRESALEASQLAALVDELSDAVIVCSRDGRVLLYNDRVRRLLVREGHEAAHSLGLGRSIFSVLDRGAFLHALSQIDLQHGRGAPGQRVAFTTTLPSGRLIPVRFAAFYAPDATDCAGLVVSISEAPAPDAVPASALHDLQEALRNPLANVRAAAESLKDAPDMATRHRDAFVRAIAEDAARLSTLVDEASRRTALAVPPGLELQSLLARDLLTASAREVEAATRLACICDDVDESLAVLAESYSLTGAIGWLAGRLREHLGAGGFRLRTLPDTGRVALDVAWAGPALALDALHAWESVPRDGGSPLSAVLARHDAQAWPATDPATGLRYVRILLRPSGALPERSVETGASHYDFTLLSQPSPGEQGGGGRLLANLACTVFDTETTGLRPSEGDRIISVGAVRMVRNRVLRAETFERLAHPGMAVPAASTAIHGITDAMLSDAPPLERVLGEFHAFASDTVLVAHNATFDMRFLAVNGAPTGLRFDLPVLDTLQLSAVLHPDHEDHSLERICARLGIAVVGRHTALGDALVTAEVFQRMVPLLAASGVRTLEEALAASARTRFARLEY